MTKKKDNNSENMPRKKKVKISVTIDAGLLEWIDRQVEEFVFQSRSHAVEQSVYQLKKVKEKDK